jgi:DNA-binding transcriptional MocR family regulator
VLECLAEHAVARGEVTVSCRSVRELADELDLSKDSVARALQRLRRDGRVAHVGGRGDDGRFGRGHYVLSVPADVFAPEGGASQRTRSRRTRTGPKRSSQQLLLIDGGIDGSSQ